MWLPCFAIYSLMVILIEKETKQDKFDEFISPDEGLFERNM